VENGFRKTSEETGQLHEFETGKCQDI